MKLALVLLVGSLAACQSWRTDEPSHAQPPAHRGMGKDSWYGMCELYQRIAGAPTPDARQAVIEQAMPEMSPALREQHLQMMQERCH